jgi:hypothetical protein
MKEEITSSEVRKEGFIRAELYVMTKTGKNQDCKNGSTGPAAVSGSRISLRAPRHGGGGGPPLCIGKQEVGTYIYSLLYTHWAPGTTSMKFYSC